MTGNALDLGLIGLAQFAPFVALVLVAGQAADHFNRRAIIIVCHGVELLCALILLLFTLGGFQVLWPVFATLALFGAARAFRNANQSGNPDESGAAGKFWQRRGDQLLGFHVAVIVGPTVGGLLYLFGPAMVYGTAATLFCWPCCSWDRRMSSSQRSTRKRPTGTRCWKDCVSSGHGPSCSARFRSICSPCCSAARRRYCRPTPAMCFRSGRGSRLAANGAGSRGRAHVDPARVQADVETGYYWMFGGVALFGLTTIVFGLSHSFWLSLLALFVLGASDMISVYIRHLLVQMETPDVIRGRVSAVNAVFIGASNEVNSNPVSPPLGSVWYRPSWSAELPPSRSPPFGCGASRRCAEWTGFREAHEGW